MKVSFVRAVEEYKSFLGFKDLNKETVCLVGLYLILGYQRKGYGETVLKTFMKEFK